MKNSDPITFKDYSNNTLLFSIKGYEYPDCSKNPDEYDKNWLNVCIKVKDKSGEYETQDPSMLTWELKELLDWFISISKGKIPEYKTMRFIEPTIYFELQNENIKEEAALNIYLCCELKPKGITCVNKEDDYVFKTKLSLNEINKVVNSIKKLIEQYPKR